MEPGRRDREQLSLTLDHIDNIDRPQWSPVDVTGNRTRANLGTALHSLPQWSPVDVTGNSTRTIPESTGTDTAAMEPGRRDREQPLVQPDSVRLVPLAAMEPGRRDREQNPNVVAPPEMRLLAAMEPGRRDREQADVADPYWVALPLPQWSPVDVTGNSTNPSPRAYPPGAPQWSPVDVTGNRRGDGHTTEGIRTCRNGARST